MILSAVLLAGAEGAWAEAFTDPGEENPDPPNAPAERSKAQEPPKTERPGTERPKTKRPKTKRPKTKRLGNALDEIAKDDPLLARVNGEEIRWSHITESARDLPDEYRTQIEAIFPALLRRLIDVRLVVWAAREAGLAEDEEVRRLVAEFEDRVVSETFVRRQVAERISAEMLRARYGAYVDRLAAGAEVRARHVLLNSEAAAREVIEALKSGADFAELARDRSLGPSAERGGDLDYFTRDDMTPAFAQAAFALEVGEYSPDPTKTDFGWHVIKVEDHRAERPTGFLEMEAGLREEITRELMDNLLGDLRGRAEIELYPDAKRAR